MKKISFLVLMIAAFLPCWAQEPVAVVVNQSSPTTKLTMAKLRELFRCERSNLPGISQIKIYTRPSGTTEHTVMLREIFKMQDGEYRQFFAMKQMRGETDCRVTELPSRGMTMEALRGAPGAIGLVRQSEILPDMKVVSIDGKVPTDPDYALK